MIDIFYQHKAQHKPTHTVARSKQPGSVHFIFMVFCKKRSLSTFSARRDLLSVTMSPTVGMTLSLATDVPGGTATTLHHCQLTSFTGDHGQRAQLFSRQYIYLRT